MKTVLIYSPTAIYTPHFETELEIAQRELEKGNKVLWLGCVENFPNSCVERLKDPNICRLCISRSTAGMKTLKGDITLLQWPKLGSPSHVPIFNNTEEVKSFTYKQVDVGLAIVSTLVSTVREPQLPFKEYKEIIEKSCEELIYMIDSFENLIKTIAVDEAYVFNGRMSLFRPVLRILQLNKIPCFVHERAGIVEQFSLTPNTYPHDLEYKKMEILQVGSSLSCEVLEEVGAKWFVDRRVGLNLNWPSFIADQRKCNLPYDFNPQKRNIAVYISSEDEFECIDGWENWLFKDQNEGLDKILKDAPSDFFFYLRIHPNLKGITNSQTQGLEKFKNYKNCHVISAESLIDSYELALVCEKTLTFGSTIGIEATFWGKPSILAGKCMYEHLDVCYVPKNYDELLTFITLVLTPKPKENCYIYGYWNLKHGIEFKFFKPKGFFEGSFRNKSLKASILARIKYKILKLL